MQRTAFLESAMDRGLVVDGVWAYGTVHLSARHCAQPTQHKDSLIPHSTWTRAVGWRAHAECDIVTVCCTVHHTRAGTIASCSTGTLASLPSRGTQHSTLVLNSSSRVTATQTQRPLLCTKPVDSSFVMSRSLSTLALLCVLFVVLFACADARRVRSKYWQAVKDEYEQGAHTLAAIPPTMPQQVLTSLGAHANEIVVTWVTMADTSSSAIQWGAASSSALPNFTSSAKGSSFHFVDLEPAHTLRVIHTARMTDVQPGSLLSYRVGDVSTGDWSANLTFTAPTAGNEILPLIVFGDMGYLNAQSMQLVADEVQTGQSSLVVHVGDYAYDLNTQNGTYGDIFCNNLQPISSRVPYLGVQGNHENAHNVSHWKKPFHRLLRPRRC